MLQWRVMWKYLLIPVFVCALVVPILLIRLDHMPSLIEVMLHVMALLLLALQVTLLLIDLLMVASKERFVHRVVPRFVNYFMLAGSLLVYHISFADLVDKWSSIFVVLLLSAIIIMRKEMIVFTEHSVMYTDIFGYSNRPILGVETSGKRRITLLLDDNVRADLRFNKRAQHQYDELLSLLRSRFDKRGE